MEDHREQKTLWVLIDPLGRNKIKACPDEVNELRGILRSR